MNYKKITLLFVMYLFLGIAPFHSLSASEFGHCYFSYDFGQLDELDSQNVILSEENNFTAQSIAVQEGLEELDPKQSVITVKIHEDNQRIFGCGMKSITLAPIFNSTDPDDWSSDNNDELNSSENTHACIISLDENIKSKLRRKHLTKVRLFNGVSIDPDSDASYSLISNPGPDPDPIYEQYNILVNNYHLLAQDSSVDTQKELAAKNKIIDFYQDWFYGDNSAMGGKCAFHVRNPNFISTGIKLRDRDEFSIQWSGVYTPSSCFNTVGTYMPPGGGTPRTLHGDTPEVLNEVFKNYAHESSHVYEFDVNNQTCQSLARGSNNNTTDPITGIQGEELARKIMDLKNSIFIGAGYRRWILSGAYNKYKVSGIDTMEISDIAHGLWKKDKIENEDTVNWHGIEAMSNEISIPGKAPDNCGVCEESIDGDESKCTEEEHDRWIASPTISESCKKLRACEFDAQTKLYKNPSDCLSAPKHTISTSFSGVFSNLGSSTDVVGIAHPQISNLNNNTGGYNVIISSYACPNSTTLEGLKYRFVKETTDATTEAVTTSTSESYDVTLDMIENTTPLPHTENNRGSRLEFFVEPFIDNQDEWDKNASGTYAIHVSDSQTDTAYKIHTNEGLLEKMSNQIYSFMYGKGNKQGAVEKVWRGIVVNTQFMQMVRALLVMYIAFTSIGFLMGTIQTNKQDVIIRVLKISLVLTLISENSWTFFMNFAFKGLIQGTLDLISAITYSMLSISELTADDFDHSNLSAFSVYDAFFRQMFSGVIWLKMLSLLFMGNIIIAGIIFVLGVFIIYHYLIIILKAFIMLLTTTILLSFFICLGPIFVPFVLFQQTKNLFDQWWKYMLSLALQPVFLFITLAIFHFITVGLLFDFLSFTICKTCLLSYESPALIIRGMSSIAIISFILMCKKFISYILKIKQKIRIAVTAFVVLSVGAWVAKLAELLVSIIPGAESLLFSSVACLIKIYKPIEAIHGAGSILIVTKLSLAITIMILLKGMQKFADFSSSLAIRIITGQYSSAVSAVGVAEKIQEGAKSMGGINQEAKGRRVGEAKEAVSKAQSDLDGLQGAKGEVESLDKQISDLKGKRVGMGPEEQQKADKKIASLEKDKDQILEGFGVDKDKGAAGFDEAIKSAGDDLTEAKSELSSRKEKAKGATGPSESKKDRDQIMVPTK